MKTKANYAEGLPPVSVVMDLLAQLGIQDGVAPLRGPYVRQIDEHWRVCLNPDEAPYHWGGFTIPRFHCAIEFNGWPAGLLNPFEGTIAAGKVANEEALIAALRAAIEAPAGPGA